MCHKIFKKEELNLFKKIEKKIEKFQKIIILGHVNPDGDSIGSQLGLQEILKQKFPKKQILISFDFSTISNFKFLEFENSNLIKNDFNESLIILVDVQNKDRTEYPKYNFKNLIIIDHHKKIKIQICLNWIDEKYAAAAQMIVDISRNLNWKFTSKAATALLTGIITDTGSFKYSSVTNETFENASFLMKQGSDLQLIHENINKLTNNDIKVLNYIYKNIIIEKKMIYLMFKPSDKNKLPFLKYHIEIRKFIGRLNFAENNLVIVFFIQLEKENIIKCSLRGRKNFNVRKIAYKFGGGGHFSASGIKLNTWKDVGEVIKEIKKNLN